MDHLTAAQRLAGTRAMHANRDADEMYEAMRMPDGIRLAWQEGRETARSPDLTAKLQAECAACGAEPTGNPMENALYARGFMPDEMFAFLSGFFHATEGTSSDPSL